MPDAQDVPRRRIPPIKLQRPLQLRLRLEDPQINVPPKTSRLMNRSFCTSKAFLMRALVPSYCATWSMRMAYLRAERVAVAPRGKLECQPFVDLCYALWRLQLAGLLDVAPGLEHQLLQHPSSLAT